MLLSTGVAEINRLFFAEHKLDCLVLLQKQMEVATAYQANGTPSGYLISPEGKIASELAMGAEALLALAEGKAESGKQKAESEESSLVSSFAGNGRENRFRNRSLAGSRLKRDGLKAGTPAPSFCLPRLDGRGELSLEDFRGQRVLLVFSSPHCGPCNALAPELEKFHRAQQNSTISHIASAGENGQAPTAVQVLMISKDDPAENRAKVKEHRLTFPILLQQQWEISRLYAIFPTPVAYLINENGLLLKDVAVGVEPIQQLLSSLPEPAPQA